MRPWTVRSIHTSPHGRRQQWDLGGRQLPVPRARLRRERPGDHGTRGALRLLRLPGGNVGDDHRLHSRFGVKHQVLHGPFREGMLPDEQREVRRRLGVRDMGFEVGVNECMTRRRHGRSRRAHGA